MKKFAFAGLLLMATDLPALALDMQLHGKNYLEQFYKLEGSGHSYEAFQICQKVLAEVPNDPVAWTWEAQILYDDYVKNGNLQNLDGALNAIQTAYFYDPTFFFEPPGMGAGLMVKIEQQEAEDGQNLNARQ
jgi:hypothetical protein